MRSYKVWIATCFILIPSGSQDFFGSCTVNHGIFALYSESFQRKVASLMAELWSQTADISQLTIYLVSFARRQQRLQMAPGRDPACIRLSGERDGNADCIDGGN